jgi:hypothetical protein
MRIALEMVWLQADGSDDLIEALPNVRTRQRCVHYQGLA